MAEVTDKVLKTGGGHLVVKNVTKIYDPLGANVLAVDNCNLELKPGEFLAIVGPSGCGKTTLLNMIAGFDSLTRGEIKLNGKTIGSPTTKLKPGSDRVVVFQSGALFPWKSLLENVMLGPVMQGLMKKDEAKKKAMDLLKMIGLKEFASSYPLNVSSGMQRRTEIVRALMTDPEIILLDEPFRALDALTKSIVHQYVLQVYNISKKSIFFITHDLDEAIYLSDRVFIMSTRPGRLKESIEVSLPRPRTPSMSGSSEFLHLKEKVFDLVHDEALKAFERGERELAG
ncbi:MAG: ABC transporter ATP-binding protein [Nitrososphaeraceae archaeon]